MISDELRQRLVVSMMATQDENNRIIDEIMDEFLKEYYGNNPKRQLAEN